MNPTLQLARKNILQLVPYSSARLESNALGLHLDANENPFPQKEGWNRYPSPQPPILKQMLAEYYGVEPSQLLMTRGSDEGIDLLLRAFCEPNQDTIMLSTPTYGMYEVAASIQGVQVQKIPLLAPFALDSTRLLTQYGPTIKLIFLCSPNNPTGNLLNATEILTLCETLQDRAIVVVDEAYIEFSTASSFCRNSAQYPNLVILRTLSKAFGLAAIRLGSLIAHPEVITLLQKILAPYPIPKPVEEAAIQALSIENLAVINSQIQIIRVERERLSAFLQILPSVQTVYPSEANFILIKVLDAQRWMSCCRANQIIIRNRAQIAGLDHCLRITIGTPKDNDRLMEVLRHV